MTDQRITAENDDSLARMLRRRVRCRLTICGFPQKRNKCLLFFERETREQFFYFLTMDCDRIEDFHFRNGPGYLLLKAVEVGKPEIIRCNCGAFSFCFTGAFLWKNIG